MVRRKVGKIIAITGGIGSGKSTVSKLIEDMGYFVVSSDEIVKGLYKKRSFLKKVKAMFPSGVSGKLILKAKKNEIAKIVFNDRKKLEELNSLIHPLVINEILTKCKNAKGEYAFAEVPLLFEGKFENRFDNVIIVKRKLEDRIDSVIKRSNLEGEQVLDRIKNQFDYENTDLSKYIVVENEKDIDSLKLKIKETIDRL